ncbi:hypothetical protein [Helicobacter sp.]|uniref:hypothetical protein n=1 Tax=Helicobacter sp. TaxID=218 RepID=UPI00388F4E99
MKPIMLVDRPTKISIKENNSSVLLPNISNNGEFDIVSSLEQLEGYYVKPFRGNAKGKIVPMAQYIALQGCEFIKPLIPSELYENVYFEAESFEQQYWEEYKAIAESFATTLGNNSMYKVFEKKVEAETYKKEQETKAKAGGRYKVIRAEGGVDLSDKQSQESAETFSQEASMTSLQPKCSIDEMKQWLEQKKINIPALPNTLQNLIEEFLNKGCLMCKIEVKKETSSTISATQKSINKLQANIEALPPFEFAANLKRSIREASTQSSKTEVYLCIECKHDGIEK